MDDSLTTISATEADWSREKVSRFWDPGPQVLYSIRAYQKCNRRHPWGKVRSLWFVVRHRFWEVVAGTDIPLNCHLGGGLRLGHPNGVVIHPKAEVGPNCIIFQQVTLTAGVRLGGHVDIGSGAKIIRPVTIGDHAKIGANAVVLEDVPAGATAVGIPARVVERAPTSHLRERKFLLAEREEEFIRRTLR